MLLSVISNQQLCKLISLDDPFNEPDIEDTTELLFKKIYPLPRIPDVSESASNFINIYFGKFGLLRSNMGVKSGVITFEVICHIDLWRIAGQGVLRPLLILHEIDEMINKTRIVGIKKAEFNELSPLYVNPNYMGYRITYDVMSAN